MRTLSKAVVLSVFAGFVASAMGEDAISKRYLLPVWYTGKVEPRVSGKQVTVKARLQVNLAAMKNAHVRLEAGEGLKPVSSALSSSASRHVEGTVSGNGGVSSRTAASSHTSSSSSSSGGGQGAFDGDLPPGGKVDFEAVFEAEPGADHSFVTLAFDYDFPAGELLDYIARHEKDLYPDPALRELLLHSVKLSHQGRKSEGVTERVDFGGASR